MSTGISAFGINTPIFYLAYHAEEEGEIVSEHCEILFRSLVHHTAFAFCRASMLQNLGHLGRYRRVRRTIIQIILLQQLCLLSASLEDDRTWYRNP